MMLCSGKGCVIELLYLMLGLRDLRFPSFFAFYSLSLSLSLFDVCVYMFSLKLVYAFF
jgi:hypothetical protein